MSKGCVTVAANARLRAARQSEHSFAPEGEERPQIVHFIASFSASDAKDRQSKACSGRYDVGIITRLREQANSVLAPIRVHVASRTRRLSACIEQAVLVRSNRDWDRARGTDRAECPPAHSYRAVAAGSPE